MYVLYVHAAGGIAMLRVSFTPADIDESPPLLQPGAFLFYTLYKINKMTAIDFTISGTSISALHFNASVRGNSFLANDPSVLFDAEADIDPLEYLLGGYAGCINLMFHTVAGRLHVNINKLNLKINGSINPHLLLYGHLPAITSFARLTVVIDIKTNTNPLTELALIREVMDTCYINDKEGNETEMNYRLAKADRIN